MDNLAREGITVGVHQVGDVMLDLLSEQLPEAESRSRVLQAFDLTPGGFLVATIHRAANTDQPDRLAAILKMMEVLGEPVIFPVHPRTRKAMERLGRPLNPLVRLSDPVGYVDMMVLIRNARMVLTDSGGVQKEAFFLATPCLTLRETTEWVETVEAGWNRLVGVDRDSILSALRTWKPTGVPPDELFGNGRAAERIAEILGRWG